MKARLSLWLAVAAFGGLTSAASAQFANNCVAAPAVNEGVYSFDLVDFTNDYAGTCGTTGFAPDGWIRYVASGNGTATVSTCGLTSGDTVLTVRNGDCGGAEIVCLDDSCGPAGVQTSVSFPVTSGSVYSIRIAGFRGNVFAGQVAITRPNDNCSDATNVGNGTVPFDNSAATTDGPTNCGFNTTNDLWYRYFTPGPGTLTVSTCGSANFDTVLSAFAGCGGALLACNDDVCGLQSSINIPMAAGTAVIVRLAGFNGQSGTGQVRFSFNSADSCQNAPVVGMGVFGFNNTTAIDDGVDGCLGANDVWFRVVSPGFGWIDATTCGLTGLDTVLAAFNTCGGPQIICNDDSCVFQSTIAVPVTPGSETLVRVSGFRGLRGSGQVRFTFRSNDNCGNATPVSDGLYGFDTGAASSDGPTICGSSGNNVWFSYAAPRLGRLNVNTCNLTGLDSVLTAFDGCGGGTLACNDDACGFANLNSSIDFSVQPGNDYRISLGGFLGNRGSGQVRFTFTPCRADFNGDGFLDFFDYDAYVDCFETGVCPPGETADFNGDQFVDFFDYDDFVVAFETGC